MPETQSDIVLDAQHIIKIFGRQKQMAAARKLMDEGLGKEEIFRRTGCTTALCDVSFRVKRGEIFVIIGLSGSGKSTIIRCFNKLVTPTDGHVQVEGKTVNELSKKELVEFRRKTISMVFQSCGLFTHRSVLKNVAYGLEVRGVSRQEREAKAREYIELVGLSGLENSPIKSLSGGMKQRVGLARALCNNPDVLLMDEPFSALDPLVRSSMQDELLAIQKKLGKTILFITHDINEAFRLGERVAIMRDGRIIQTGTPACLLTGPENDYVKSFVGNSDQSAILSAGMIMQPAAITANINEDAAMRKAGQNATDQGIPFIYLVDSRSKFKGVVPARECKPGVKPETAPVTIDSSAKIKSILPIAAETPYPLPVTSSNGILLGVVSKASLLKAMK
jgi:glycine betaine/proline transport system ATP-binding protein